MKLKHFFILLCFGFAHCAPRKRRDADPDAAVRRHSQWFSNLYSLFGSDDFSDSAENSLVESKTSSETKEEAKPVEVPEKVDFAPPAFIVEDFFPADENKEEAIENNRNVYSDDLISGKAATPTSSDGLYNDVIINPVDHGSDVYTTTESKIEDLGNIQAAYLQSSPANNVDAFGYQIPNVQNSPEFTGNQVVFDNSLNGYLGTEQLSSYEQNYNQNSYYDPTAPIPASKNEDLFYDPYMNTFDSYSMNTNIPAQTVETFSYPKEGVSSQEFYVGNEINAQPAFGVNDPQYFNSDNNLNTNQAVSDTQGQYTEQGSTNFDYIHNQPSQSSDYMSATFKGTSNPTYDPNFNVDYSQNQPSQSPVDYMSANSPVTSNPTFDPNFNVDYSQNQQAQAPVNYLPTESAGTSTPIYDHNANVDYSQTQPAQTAANYLPAESQETSNPAYDPNFDLYNGQSSDQSDFFQINDYGFASFADQNTESFDSFMNYGNHYSTPSHVEPYNMNMNDWIMNNYYSSDYNSSYINEPSSVGYDNMEANLGFQDWNIYDSANEIDTRQANPMMARPEEASSPILSPALDYRNSEPFEQNDYEVDLSYNPADSLNTEASLSSLQAEMANVFPESDVDYNPEEVIDVPDMLDFDAAIPNKDLSPGIPNKQNREEIDFSEIPLDINLEEPDVPLAKEECHTATGQIGECMTAKQCGAENGKMDGLCHQGMDDADYLRSCCIFQSYCGYKTNKEVTYLKNPDYPRPTSDGGDCIFKLDLLPDVCQVRLDFLELEMKPSEDGECEDENALHIRSSDPDAVIPVRKLCGTVSQGVSDELTTDIPHLYVHVNREPYLFDQAKKRVPNKEDDPSIRLVLKVKDHPSRWNIRAMQVTCDGANLQAPDGCAQYYNGRSGNISSFNLLDGQYQKNMRLTSCIKRDPLACAVEYNVKEFSLGAPRGEAGKIGYGLTCKDYLLIGGEKTALCGKLNSPRKFIFPANRPESLFFSSDNQCSAGDRGFSLEYVHHYHCEQSDYYKYPVKK